MPGSARDLLGRVFGYDRFRGQQEAIIEHTIAGGDSLVLMPTGGGKSLCYQIPALVRSGAAVVVSPPHRADARPGRHAAAGRRAGGLP